MAKVTELSLMNSRCFKSGNSKTSKCPILTLTLQHVHSIWSPSIPSQQKNANAKLKQTLRDEACIRGSIPRRFVQGATELEKLSEQFSILYIFSKTYR